MHMLCHHVQFRKLFCSFRLDDSTKGTQNLNLRDVSVKSWNNPNPKPLFSVHRGHLDLSNVDIIDNYFKAIHASGELSSVHITDSYISRPRGNEPCGTFSLLPPSLDSFSVEDTVFDDIDTSECLENVDFTVNTNQLSSVDFKKFAANIESQTDPEARSIFDNDGELFYIQVDAEKKRNTSLTGEDGSLVKYITTEADLTYGESDYSILTNKGDALIPSIIQIRSLSDACFSSVRVKRGQDVLVEVNATMFEECSSICFLSEDRSECADEMVDFVYDRANMCMLLSQQFALDLTVDLNEFRCGRLIPPTLMSPYSMSLNTMSLTPTPSNVDSISVIINDDESFLSLSNVKDSLSTYRVQLEGTLIPKKVVIEAPSSGQICVSSIIVERLESPTWTFPMSDFEKCSDSCNQLYNRISKCINLSSSDGYFKTLTIDLNREGCERFKTEISGSFIETETPVSVCSAERTVTTYEEIIDSVDLLNNHDFSEITLFVQRDEALFDRTLTVDVQRDEALFDRTLTIDGPAVFTMEFIGNRTSDGDTYTLEVATGVERLFSIQTGVDLTLIGFTIKGGIQNVGGNVLIRECTITDAASSTDGGAILNRKGGTVDIDSSEILITSSGGRGGGVATIEGSVTTLTASILQENTADVNGDSVFNDMFSYTTIDWCTFDSAQDLMNELNGSMTVKNVDFLNEAAFPTGVELEIGSAMIWTYIEEWCAKHNTVLTPVGNISMLIDCYQECQNEAACISVAFDFSAKECFKCNNETDCQLPCNNDTDMYKYEEECNAVEVVSADNDVSSGQNSGVCLKTSTQAGMLQRMDLPVSSDIPQLCKEYCGYYKKCRAFTLDGNFCNLYASGDFGLEGECIDRVYIKYDGDVHSYTYISDGACVEGSPSATFLISDDELGSQCESICLAYTDCRGFRVLSDSGAAECELYTQVQIIDDCPDRGGEVYLDLTRSSFPKGQFASFHAEADVSLGKKALKDGIRSSFSQASCQQFCDIVAGCTAVHFNDQILECRTFTRKQLLLALQVVGKSVATFSYLVSEITYASFSEESYTTLVGCPILLGFQNSQTVTDGFQNEKTASLTEGACAELCLTTVGCDFFRRNQISKTCDFFTKPREDYSCTSANATMFSPSESTIFELIYGAGFTDTQTNARYHEASKECVLQRPVQTFTLGAANSEYDNKKICKHLCGVNPDCVAAFVSETKCTLLDVVIVVDQTEALCDGDFGWMSNFYISLESIQNAENWLRAPAKVCPLSSYASSGRFVNESQFVNDTEFVSSIWIPGPTTEQGCQKESSERVHRRIYLERY
eukprot:scaffold76281_cov61-Attheya_sp.AAC.2